eukprot:6212912-Karenia_brevis.AAC.1
MQRLQDSSEHAEAIANFYNGHEQQGSGSHTSFLGGEMCKLLSEGGKGMPFCVFWDGIFKQAA